MLLMALSLLFWLDDRGCSSALTKQPGPFMAQKGRPRGKPTPCKNQSKRDQTPTKAAGRPKEATKRTDKTDTKAQPQKSEETPNMSPPSGQTTGTMQETQQSNRVRAAAINDENVAERVMALAENGTSADEIKKKLGRKLGDVQFTPEQLNRLGQLHIDPLD